MVAFLAMGTWVGGGHAADVGDTVPDFTCLNDQGKLWNSRDHVGKWPLVIYFYPSDFSFCCTRQAICYRDKQDELSKQCLEVVGISSDAVEVHRLFKSTHGLKFALLSDSEGQIARQFGVPLRVGGKAMATDSQGQVREMPRKFTAARWTFIIGTDGRILHRDTGASPMKDSQVVLEFLQGVNVK